MPTEKPRVTITIEQSTLQRVIDYQHENRCKNQTQAILELVSLGLEAETDGRIDFRDEDLGLMDQDEKGLLQNYRSLSKQGKEYIRQTMFMAVSTYKKDYSDTNMETSEEIV